MTHPSSDEDLMVLVQRGDADAFATLFARHRSPLYGYILRLARRPELADEVFQDAFLSVHRASATWSAAAGTFRSWLYRIATNALRDAQRKSARRPEILDDELVIAVRDSPGERLDLERALAELPDNLRDAFLLASLSGLDHNEIASVLDISPDNARARVSRARARLRELLGAT